MKFLGKYADFSYALLRIVTGFLFLFHGCQKILGVFAASQPPVWSQLWIGGIIELVGGLMAVAYFQYHWKFQIGPQIFPAINKGELAVLFCLVFLYIACRGGVKWCLDKNDR
jgi:putative oxidoreductase